MQSCRVSKLWLFFAWTGQFASSRLTIPLTKVISLSGATAVCLYAALSTVARPNSAEFTFQILSSFHCRSAGPFQPQQPPRRSVKDRLGARSAAAAATPTGAVTRGAAAKRHSTDSPQPASSPKVAKQVSFCFEHGVKAVISQTVTGSVRGEYRYVTCFHFVSTSSTRSRPHNQWPRLSVQ